MLMPTPADPPASTNARVCTCFAGIEADDLSLSCPYIVDRQQTTSREFCNHYACICRNSGSWTLWLVLFKIATDKSVCRLFADSRHVTGLHEYSVSRAAGTPAWVEIRRIISELTWRRPTAGRSVEDWR